METKEESKLRYREYYHKNKEKHNKYNSAWKKQNPLRNTYHSHLYKISGYTYEEFESHLLNLGWKPKLHIDHKIPVTHFFPDTPIRLINDLRNLQVITLIENASKSNRYQDIVDKEYYEEVKKYLVF